MRKLLLSFITVLLLTSCATQETTTVSRATSGTTEFALPIMVPKASASSPAASGSIKATPTKAVSTKEAKARKLNALRMHMVKHGLGSSTAARYAQYILDAGNKYDIDPFLILSIIHVETGGTFKFANHPNSHGAIGLMQILKSNAGWMGVRVSELYDPKTNINLGTMYLAKLQKRFGYDKGIIAYNQGEGNVSRGTYRTWYLKKVKEVYRSVKR